MEKSERDIMLGLARAEAAGQAKIYSKEIAMQFNAIRKEDVRKYSTMAEQSNKLGVMLAVVIDLLVNDGPIKQADFNALCAKKEAELKKK